MKDIHFSSIEIVGFRGRNFTLEMNPRGEHTVFVMDGNTGKTTTIDLLRWCFKYPQSECIGKFSHMWVDSAHVLDEFKTTPQRCKIIIQFTAFDEKGCERAYSFVRSVDGITEKTRATNANNFNTDHITNVHDVLEIDHGKEVINGDDVNKFLEKEFYFKECADFLCFDGEKAREIMRLSSSSDKIVELLHFVNQRATHPRIEEYKQRLNGVKNRILEEADTKVTEGAQDRLYTQYRKKQYELVELKKEKEKLNLEITANLRALNELKAEKERIDEKISQARTEEIKSKIGLEMELKAKEGEVDNKRSSFYQLSSQWFSIDTDLINELKSQVKERGDLPEPFRNNLISKCLASNKCEICGRTLDENSKKHVVALSQVTASPEVHNFLSSDLVSHTSVLHIEEESKRIKDLITGCKRVETLIANIKLSKEDEELFNNKARLADQIEALTRKDETLRKTTLKDLDELIGATAKEEQNLRDRSVVLGDYKFVLDKIDAAIDKVEAVGDVIKEKTIGIISSVISENVSMILGEKFSAKLTEQDGLMLGEDGFFGRDLGGYSGRLILSYCFAEAMTLVDPIIVDTPVGNIGSHREQLAKHLVTNHKQIILLCLPTEIDGFGPHISLNVKKIVNKETEYK